MSESQRAIDALLDLMARLRDPAGGCPWDREQTFATVVPYTLEEAYEVADAVDRGDPRQLREELGDLLFQIVFHSRMAQERGWFDFAAVATTIHDKLVRRHPHVFAGAAVQGTRELNRTWEDLKARERAEAAQSESSPDHSAVANIPRALPALTRAAKLGRRVARVGFDWQEPGQVRAKVLEELAEVDAEVDAEMNAGTNAEMAESPAGDANQTPLAEELGDLLFAVANWSVHLQVDPEEALRAANAKFERRFRHMERLAAQSGTALQTLSAAQWDDLWRKAKQA